jgi:hypothetical protein
LGMEQNFNFALFASLILYPLIEDRASRIRDARS